MAYRRGSCALRMCIGVAVWLGALASNAEAQDSRKTTWSCVSADHQPERSETPLVSATIFRWGRPIRQELSWKFWSDGTAELRTHFVHDDFSTPLELSRGFDFPQGSPFRDYVCSSKYRAGVLEEFLRVVSRSGVCSRSKWSDLQGYLDPPPLRYQFSFRVPGQAPCDTTLVRGRLPFSVKQLYSLDRGWTNLRLNTCGTCELPPGGTKRFVVPGY